MSSVQEPFSDFERVAMARAVACARLGHPSPNPHVGAVVVTNGTLVAEGWHARAGADHAEVAALRVAGDRARGATVFVTLEPCNHHGRTPPCTEALLRAGVTRVVYAVADPNPHVAGGGAETLRRAGIEVGQGFDAASQQEVEYLLKPWRTFITRARAHVTLKLAMTLDGRIATRSGESRWITSAASRRDAHMLRATCDAIVVGSRTVLADDPRLTAREVPIEGARAVRVVIDSALVTPTTSQLAQTARDVPTWVCTVEDGTHPNARALAMCGVEVLTVARREGRVDLADALRVLASRGVVSVLCEGGGALHGALLDAQLADRVVCYVAPCIVGGVSATPAVGGLGVATLAEAYRVESLRVSHIGDDLKIEGELRCSQGSFKP